MITPLISSSLLRTRNQRCISAGGSGVHGKGTLGRKPQQIMRPTCLGPCTAQALSTEWLHPDHRADLVAVDVHVAHAGAGANGTNGFLDAGMNAERQPIPAGVNRIDNGH